MTTPMTLRKVKKSGQQPETSNYYLPETKDKKPQPLSLRKIKKEPSFTGNETYDNAIRTGLQIPQGLAEVTAPGLIASAWQLLGQGEVLDPEEIEHIKSISEREGIPFDEEKYMEAAQNALSYIPTVSNIARGIEEETGLPLEAKTDLQKGIRLASAAGKIAPNPGTFRGMNVGIPKPVLGVGVAGTSQVLKELGVPEPLSDMASFGILKGLNPGSAKIGITTSKKPSGLTTRQFEKLKEPVEVSGKKIKQIDEKLEADFRDIASDIIEKSPINETHSELKNDSGFKMAAEEAFEKVDKLAESITEKVSLEDLKKDLIKRGAEEKKSGITELEFDKEYNKNIKQFVKDTKGKDASLSGIIKQYRKNNEAYGKSWESGKSTDYNVAKREALLDYNRTIADMIEKKFPDSEFANLFKSSNEQWKKIMDAEAVDAYVDDIFKGKINYKKNGEFFNKKQKQIFKRALGDEGYKNFEQLNKDFMSTEKAYKMMNVAKEKGYWDVAKTAFSYVLHPSVAKAKVGFDMTKGAYKALWESVLDKPQLAVTWDKGIKAFQKGDFATAEKQFNKLKQEEVVRSKALKQFKDNKSNKAPEVKESEPTKSDKKEHTKINWDDVEIEIKDSKELDRSRFSNIKDAYSKKGDYLGGLSYDLEPSGEVYISGIYVEPNLKKQGIGKRLFKDLLEKNKDKNIVLSPLQPEGAKFFSKIIDRDLKPQLTDSYDKIPKVSQEPIKLTKKDIENAKKNLGLNKKAAPKIDWDAVEKTLEDIYKRDYKEPVPTPEVLKEKLPEIKRQDISKSGLKTQKEFILTNLEDAIANPDKFKNEKFINLSVPGDGEFKIKNDQKALAQFYKSVKSKWPDKPLRKSSKTKDIQYPDYAYKEHEIAAEKKRNDYLNSQKDQSQSNRKKPKMQNKL